MPYIATFRTYGHWNTDCVFGAGDTVAEAIVDASSWVDIEERSNLSVIEATQRLVDHVLESGTTAWVIDRGTADLPEVNA